MTQTSGQMSHRVNKVLTNVQYVGLKYKTPTVPLNQVEEVERACTFLWRKTAWSDLWWTPRWTPEGFLRHRSEQIPAGRWATSLNKDSCKSWTVTTVCTQIIYTERGKKWGMNVRIHLPKGFQGDNVVRRWVSFHKACFCQSQDTLYRLLRKHTQRFFCYLTISKTQKITQ